MLSVPLHIVSVEPNQADEKHNSPQFQYLLIKINLSLYRAHSNILNRKQRYENVFRRISYYGNKVTPVTKKELLLHICYNNR